MMLTKCTCDAIQPGQLYADESGICLYLRILNTTETDNTLCIRGMISSYDAALCNESGDHPVYLVLDSPSVANMFGKISDAVYKELNKC